MDRVSSEAILDEGVRLEAARGDVPQPTKSESEKMHASPSASQTSSIPSHSPSDPRKNGKNELSAKSDFVASETSRQSSSDKQTQLSEKRFIKLHNTYFEMPNPAGLKNDGEVKSASQMLRQPEKKFIRGVDAYIKLGKKNADGNEPEPDKKFLQGVDAYIQAGKRGKTGVFSEPDKKFLRGVDAYIKAGKSNTGDALAAPDKKFMRGIDPYIQAGKRNLPDVAQLPDKKFMQGMEAYMQKAGKRDNDASVTINSPDKKFMQGMEAYMQQTGKRDNDASINSPDKKFMRGTEAYMQQTGKRDNDTSINSPDKKFMRGMETYMQQAGKMDSEPFLNSLDKRFMQGMEAYIQQAGKRINTEADVTLPSAGDKRFMRGIDLYIKRNLNPETKRTDDVYYFEDVGISPVNAVKIFEDNEKRFMKGFQHYMKSDDGHIFRHTSAPSLDKRFMRGVDMYLRGNGKRESTSTKEISRADVNTNLAESQNSANDKINKRFMKGVNHYLQQIPPVSGGKRESEAGDIWKSEHLQSEEKRFMKGVNVYLQHHSAHPPPQPTQRVKRNAGEQEVLPFEKRFLKGTNPYLRRFTNSQTSAKRFLRIPHLMEDSQPSLWTQHDEPFKRSDSDRVEPLSKDKRFMKGIDKYLSAYIQSQPQKRFMKGINQYLQAYRSGRSPVVGKRFMKGINPYLQAYYSSMANKRLYGYYPHTYSTSREKRFMKLPNPYLRQFSSQAPDERYGEQEFSSGNSIDKRFMKGLGPYLLRYVNRPQIKRVLGNEAEEDFDDVYDGDGQSVEKRFLKGNNPHLWSFFNSQSPKRETFVTPDRNKRFLKGVDYYLQTYSNRPRIRRSAGDTHQKRFIKNFDYYLRLYDKLGKEDSSTHTDMKPAKRSAQATQFVQGRDKGDNREKRFLRGMDDYLMTVLPSVKRFLKGVDPYLNSYSKQQGKRDGDYHTMLRQNASVSSDDTHTSGKSSAVSEMKSVKETNRDLLEHSEHKSAQRSAGDGPDRRKRSIPYFGLSLASKPDLSTEKRFARGPNQYLRAFTSAPRTTRRDYLDLQTYIGDVLVKELAKTAESMKDKGVLGSAVFDGGSSISQWDSEGGFNTFPRQALYKDSLSDPLSPHTKRVFPYRQRSWLPRYGGRQFMIWSNGDYRQG